MSIPRYRPVALLLLVLHLGGCMTWRPVPVGPLPSDVRVSRADGTQMRLHEPRLEAEFLTGLVFVRAPDGPTRPPNGRQETSVRISLADVTAVEEKQLSVGRTMLVTVGSVAGLIVLAVMFSPRAGYN